MLGITGDISTSALATFSKGLQHMDTLVLADLQKATFISFVRILCAIMRTYQVQWKRERERERKRERESVCVRERERERE